MSTMRDPAHSIVQDREIPADDGPGRDESPTLTRREFVTATAVAGAALGLESATFGVPNIVSGAAASTIKFGLLEDRSGNFAIFGLNKWHGTQLAIKEINDGFTLKGGLQGPGSPGVFAKVAAKPPIEHPKLGSGSSVIDRGEAPSKDAVVWDEADEYLEKSGDQGVLGRKIDLIAPDPQSDNRQFQSLARRLILQDKADVIMAGFASAEREALRPIMDENKMLYFYNNQYEGGVADKYTFCTGALPEQQILPVMQYMIQRFGRRIYTLAADYNFGQLSAAWTRAMAPVLGAEVIGEEFIPLSVSQFSSSIARIQQVKPDWLMMYITGQNHSNYYPQAQAAGVRIPMGSSINIAQGYEHLRFKPPALARFHVTASYMEEIPTPRNRKFVERWRKMFPDEPYMAMEGHSAYVATHLYAKAVRLARTTDKPAVMEALESGIGVEAPAGWVRMDPATHHLSQYIRLASCDENHNITFVAEWPHIDPWWTRRLGVNLVRTPEYKQYIPDEDPFFKKFLKK
ncbi:MAG: twin-arginine translocation signal domain-containing protein [Bacillati bacterium ANGP1]|uniref:Twin-arginine translocation signal domain-containing protein n=1 Tax=Candidatus Segetimicrobium genomatis TaxID=2569760 RepID=A0A537JZG4_9BACT|nr:MAG: twin-arginine translocation signal domain-containing protein [Terrabacteria group bacterium ANGP1]